jgi:hypothetical protein
MSRSKDNHLHIVSFDIPVPANYGGAIDIFYKLKALHANGLKIHLHCFQYGGRKKEPQLHEFCEEVHYYKRKSFAQSLSGNFPYIVNSRRDDLLLERLVSQKFPILFEGIHSCFYLPHPKLRYRKKIVRTHNIEHDYYTNLAKTEKNYFRKLYYLNEAKALADFEKKLKYADGLAVISKNDYKYFSKKYKNVFTISAFHPNESVDILPGKGNYALYHGSLEVNENHHAAMYLVKDVFRGLDMKLIIAGNKPKHELVNAVEGNPDIEIRSGLSVEQIHSLVREAQVNILPTFQATGIKLKLLLALYQGRHCLVNTPMVINTGLQELCSLADDTESFRNQLKRLFEIEMLQDEIEQRKSILLNNGFMNFWNADLLIRKMFTKK